MYNYAIVSMMLFELPVISGRNILVFALLQIVMKAELYST